MITESSNTVVANEYKTLLYRYFMLPTYVYLSVWLGLYYLPRWLEIVIACAALLLVVGEQAVYYVRFRSATRPVRRWLSADYEFPRRPYKFLPKLRHHIHDAALFFPLYALIWPIFY